MENTRQSQKKEQISPNGVGVIAVGRLCSQESFAERPLRRTTRSRLLIRCEVAAKLQGFVKVVTQTIGRDHKKYPQLVAVSLIDLPVANLNPARF